MPEEENPAKRRALTNAFHSALTGGAERTTHHDRGFLRAWNWLVRHHGGSKKKAAEAIGLHPGTIRDYLSGRKFKSRRAQARAQARALPKARAARRQAVTDPDALAAAQAATDPGGGGGFAVQGTFTISQDTRDRTINFGWHPLVGAALDAWEAGDNAEVGRLMQVAMDDIVGSTVDVPNPTIRFYDT